MPRASAPWPGSRALAGSPSTRPASSTSPIQGIIASASLTSRRQLPSGGVLSGREGTAVTPVSVQRAGAYLPDSPKAYAGMPAKRASSVIWTAPLARTKLPRPGVLSGCMRVTAGWLLLVSIVLLSADGFTPVTTNDCCCAGMSKKACPLKQRGRPSCDDHGRTHCSLARSDSGTDTRYRPSRDSRDPSTLTETPFRAWAQPVAVPFAPAREPRLIARNAL